MSNLAPLVTVRLDPDGCTLRRHLRHPFIHIPQGEAHTLWLAGMHAMYREYPRLLRPPMCCLGMCFVDCVAGAFRASRRRWKNMRLVAG